MTWTVREDGVENLATLLGEYSDGITLIEDHHAVEDETSALTGLVAGIEAISIAFREVRNRLFEPILGSARSTRVDAAPMALVAPGSPIGYVVDVGTSPCRP